MIPLRDLNPARSFPWLTYLLIAANTAVFVYQVSLEPEAGELFVRRYGLVPAYFLGHAGSLITPLTSMFMHGGFLHLIANMWSLYVFGDNVEDSLGRLRFAAFYFLSGIGAALAQALVDPSSFVPMVGASGAIAGVLGAYMKLFPRARVVTLVPLFVVFFVRELPAWIFIVLWFLVQVLSGLGSLGRMSGQGGVAFFAHIGGFVAGVVLIAFMRRKNPRLGFGRR